MRAGVTVAVLLVLGACGGEGDGSGERGFPSSTAGQAASAAGVTGGAQAGMNAVAGQAAGTFAPPVAGVGAAGVAGMAAAGTAGTAGMAPTAGMQAPVAGMAAGAAGMAGGASGAGGTGGNTAPSGPICERWKADRADLSQGAWDGDTASCDPGQMPAEALATAHRLVNLYRTMAGLDEIEMTDEGNRLAQGCALLMAANGQISHTPDASWDCYTEEAAETANTSSLSSGPAVESVDGYMIDPGNNTTLGHRRWILSNMLASIGFGSAGRFSCQYQPAQRPAADAQAWTAWPPPGEVPIEVFGGSFYSIDQTGWSVQSDVVDLNSATVTITSDGQDLAASVTPLLRGYGSTYALRIVPMGWTTMAGKTYSVKLAGTSMPIEYDVEVVTCP